MKTLEPGESAVDQEVRHLAAPEIIDKRVPIALESLAGIGMLCTDACPVEFRQSVRVGRKMAAHPIDPQANSGIVAGFHEQAEIIRRTKTAGGGRRARSLGNPRSRRRDIP